MEGGGMMGRLLCWLKCLLAGKSCFAPEELDRLREYYLRVMDGESLTEEDARDFARLAARLQADRESKGEFDIGALALAGVAKMVLRPVFREASSAVDPAITKPKYRDNRPRCEACDKPVRLMPTIVVPNGTTLYVQFMVGQSDSQSYLCTSCFKRFVSELKGEKP